MKAKVTTITTKELREYVESTFGNLFWDKKEKDFEHSVEIAIRSGLTGRKALLKHATNYLFGS